jgi:hypothetical protein
MKELSMLEFDYINGGNCLCYCIDPNNPSRPPQPFGELPNGGVCTGVCSTNGLRMITCQEM